MEENKIPESIEAEEIEAVEENVSTEGEVEPEVVPESAPTKEKKPVPKAAIIGIIVAAIIVAAAALFILLGGN